MSTDYITQKTIKFSEVFDGRLEKYGVREHIKADESCAGRRCLTDGRNYLWLYGEDDGDLGLLSRYGWNVPSRILAAISQEFGTAIYSEYEPQFLGFETQEEMDAALEAMAREDQEKFYSDIMRYVRGEPIDYSPGTIGRAKADIAKDLIAKDGGLMSPDRKQELMDTIDKIYNDDYAIRITLSDEELAFAQLAATHEDDLPQS